MNQIEDLLRSGAAAQRVSLTPTLTAGQWNTLFEADGPGMITHIWFTFPPGDKMLGRRNLLRIFWDEEREPSVEAPLSDFFGLPFGFTGGEHTLSSHYLAVAPNNGLNCYFRMPFARGARIEIFPEQLESGGGFYAQVDWYRLPEPPASDLRFHAQFRFENPCEEYGRNYLFLDAVGEGALVGATFGVETNEPQLDAWFHGGGDSIFIDGESAPGVLHGIGAEDFFGHSWGVRPFQSTCIGTPWRETNAAGAMTRVSLYRFFVHDPVPFRSSIRAVLGALGNSYSSVAYWYQREPHRRFFRTPAADARMPDATAPFGIYDVEADEPAVWRVLAPLRLDEENPFNHARPLEAEETGEEAFVYEAGGEPSRPDGDRMTVVWREQTASHGFVDFNCVGRPATRCIRLQTGVVGYALRYIDSDAEGDVRIHIGFDDMVAVRVNDREFFRGNHPFGFKETTFQARLATGRNRILVKLSNQPNTTWRLWVFSFRIES